jgi:hypothetical protein
MGALTTVWNDDGEGLFNEDWYGVLFGAVAAWQPGESAIGAYQDAYGQVFHGDASGKVGEAEKEIMAAHQALGKAQIRLDSNTLFWMDPWSAQGQGVSAKMLPVARQMRRHAEQAIVLLDEARAANAELKESDALLAMDLGARRLDLIGLKFELAQEIVDAHAESPAKQQDRTRRAEMHNRLEEISSMFGRCQDLRDAYSATKTEYSQVWLSENLPYALNNVMLRFDLAASLWQQRGDRFEMARHDWEAGKNLPPAASLEIPAAAAK